MRLSKHCKIEEVNKFDELQKFCVLFYESWRRHDAIPLLQEKEIETEKHIHEFKELSHGWELREMLIVYESVKQM